MTIVFEPRSTTDDLLAGIDLTGKRVLVAGVSAGPGLETARVLHSEDDRVLPFAASALLAVNLRKRGTLKTCVGLLHGMPASHSEIINADMMAFIGKTGGFAASLRRPDLA